MFDEADRALGFSVTELCFNGSEEALKLTANTQPAILTVSVAAYRVLEENGVQPAFVAGHSLGEFSALVAAGGLEFSDAVRLVRHRGEYMQTAVPEGVGAMAAPASAALGGVPAPVAGYRLLTHALPWMSGQLIQVGSGIHRFTSWAGIAPARLSSCQRPAGLCD